MQQRTILVLGGAGYIGSHMVMCLRRHGCEVVVLDSLVTGHRDAVREATFIQGDLGDAVLLDSLLTERRFDGVMHFASFIQVGESVLRPADYYDNNVVRTLSLMDALLRHPCPAFIFSSTAAVYGQPEYLPIDESHPTRPINPYGRSKYMIEQALEDYRRAYGLRYGALRYFNAAGADPESRTGECHEPETHLIPLVLQAASGVRSHINVYGNDYDTRDGTCVRDYIHVDDLCEAHWLLLEYLWRGGEESVFNLGTGLGYTVMEVIETARQVTGKPIPVRVEVRRAGDPASLIADGSKAQRILGWQPQYMDLATIIRHAWEWEQVRLPAYKTRSTSGSR